MNIRKDEPGREGNEPKVNKGNLFINMEWWWLTQNKIYCFTLSCSRRSVQRKISEEGTTYIVTAFSLNHGNALGLRITIANQLH